MQNPKIEIQKNAKEWSETANREAIKRVADFMREDDESFFHRTIQGLTVQEIEEFLNECPEFREYWEHGDKGEKS